MKIFPAIDIINGQAVRLTKGDYNTITVYSNDLLALAADFKAKGAQLVHMVDLDGAKTGETPNISYVTAVTKQSGIKVEIGGGVRSMETIERYLSAGVERVIIGTAAVLNPAFLREALGTYGEKVVVGVDVSDGMLAINGWLERSAVSLDDFCGHIQGYGAQTIICTDISKDGMLGGANRELYRHLLRSYDMEVVASGGISTLEEIAALRDLGLSGAIIGKAYYEGRLDLSQAVAVADGADPREFLSAQGELA